MFLIKSRAIKVNAFVKLWNDFFLFLSELLLNSQLLFSYNYGSARITNMQFMLFAVEKEPSSAFCGSLA